MPRSRSLLAAAALLALAGMQPAFSEQFSIQIAGPVAAKTYQLKSSAFVFRTLGCPASEKPEATAAAEGNVDGQRRTIPLKIAPANTPGVFGIFRMWPVEGVWIVNLTAHCGEKTAGALVATDGKGFVRESSTFYPRAATEAEIEAALKSSGRKLRPSTTH